MILMFCKTSAIEDSINKSGTGGEWRCIPLNPEVCALIMKSYIFIFSVFMLLLAGCSKPLSAERTTISGDSYHTAAVTSDGKVLVAGYRNYSQEDVSSWRHIVSVSSDDNHILGLKNDGTVIAAGNNAYGQCEVSRWTDIREIATGFNFSIGLRTDGSVVFAGSNMYSVNECTSWSDIESIFGNAYTAGGIRRNGTYIGSGAGVEEYYRPDDPAIRVIADIVFSSGAIILNTDGTVVYHGEQAEFLQEVRGWTDITAVSGGRYYLVGLRRDGTVVACGDNTYRQCEVSEWTGIVAIASGSYHTIGLREDGTIVVIGDKRFDQCDVTLWKDIAVP
jgi:hypothetical protein